MDSNTVFNIALNSLAHKSYLTLKKKNFYFRRGFSAFRYCLKK